MAQTKVTAQHVLDLLTKSGAMTAKEIASALNKQLKTKVTGQSINKNQKSSGDADIDPAYPSIFKIEGIQQDKTTFKWSAATAEAGERSPVSQHSEESVSELENLRQQLKEKTEECDRLTAQLKVLKTD
jgi:hypothetical protein